MKTIFVIPGWQEKTSSRNYGWLIKFLKHKGFRVFGVPIKWKYRVVSDYVIDFKKFYREHRTGNDYFLGFSYGAVIAFMTAGEFKPKQLYLCSLSPDFREDRTAMKSWVRKLIGKRRFEDTRTRSARTIAQTLTMPTTIFYGAVEGRRFPQLKIRCEETAALAKRAKLIIVEDAPHKIDHPKYIEAIKKGVMIRCAILLLGIAPLPWYF
ncbi:hypothetical protein C4552_02245 [Candidatus Parcubacteria bacterium]|nr:MAG: hypothetical protein C4552_02245 [Candidatus Parcubacteria bacterium]